MSLTLLPVTRIFNSVDASTVVVSDGVVSIKGLPNFNVADVVACHRECTTPCVPQVVVVTPVVPTAPCECPWTFEMVIVRRSCGFERSEQVLPHTYSYNYTNPSGDPPTVALIVASVVAQINSDPNSCVTAVDTGNTHTTITLTEKDCDSDKGRTCGFTVGGNSLTQTTSTAHVNPILPLWDVQRNFPILPGSEFSNPTTAFCGSAYCRYYFKIRPAAIWKDPHVANATIERTMELELWVNRDDASFIADWDAELVAQFTCLGAPLV